MSNFDDQQSPLFKSEKEIQLNLLLAWPFATFF